MERIEIEAGNLLGVNFYGVQRPAEAIDHDEPKNGSYMVAFPFMPFGRLRIQHERGAVAVTRGVKVRSP